MIKSKRFEEYNELKEIWFDQFITAQSLSQKYISMANGYASMGGRVDHEELNQKLQDMWNKSIHYFEYGHIENLPKLELTYEEMMDAWCRYFNIDFNKPEDLARYYDLLKQLDDFLAKSYKNLAQKPTNINKIKNLKTNW